MTKRLAALLALALTLGPSPAVAAEFEAPVPNLPASFVAVLPPTLAAMTPLASGDLMLARAAALGVTPLQVGEAIKASASLQQAMAGLQSLGLIKEGEFHVDDAGDAVSLRAALQTVWREAAPSVSAPTVDLSLPVPSFVAQKDGVTYHVHGVAHGQLAAPQGRRVRALVRKLADRGLPLYAEQNVPAHYGFSYGRETLDHAVFNGGEISFKDHQGGATHVTANEAVARWAIPLAAAAAIAAAAVHPAAWPIARAVLLSGAAFVTYQGGLPINWVKTLYYAWQARRSGETDLARYLAGLRHLLRPGADVRDILRLELPMPLKTGGVNTVERSRKIAEAVAADAAARGAKQVHLLYGINHADELVHYLGR